MKFKKFGKALLMIAASAGVVFSVTSCVQSYSVGFLYVTGTATATTSGDGIISGFKIDHNTGNLSPIPGLPVASGGQNPGRAVLLGGGRFLYVLNRGDCTVNPCAKPNITQFSIGGNGILASQETFFSQGNNPFRIIADAPGNYIYVLDHDSPSSAACALALGSGVNACGDITAFKVDQSTGRLSLVVNAQVTSATGQALPYFPVPANPIDMVLAAGYILTLSGTPGAGDSVFPYLYSLSSGQLSVSQNSSQPLNVRQANAIALGGTYVYILANDPLTVTPTDGTSPVTYPSQIDAYTVGTGGALQAQVGGVYAGDAADTNPMFVLLESKGNWLYVANQGNNTSTTNTQSGISGYVIDKSQHTLSKIPTSPWGSGPSPQCMIEDPSFQYVYTANFADSTVTGRRIDQNLGYLNNLLGSANRSFSLTGPPAYCLVTGRTS